MPPGLYLRTRRGLGTVVASGRTADARGVRIAALAERFVTDAAAAGASEAEVRAAVEAALGRRR